MNANTLSIQEAKQIDLVQYLEDLGYKPSSIRAYSYWYLSPFRDEKTPSFKVNTKINCWYDFGNGKGDSIIDFGMEHFKCSLKEFLQRLTENRQLIPRQTTGFRRDNLTSVVHENEASKIKILDFGPLRSPVLADYISSRAIHLEIAKTYCHEVSFELYNRRQIAIGFRNDAGGFELRNAQFKGSSSPKFTTLINRDADCKNLSVFEGLFDFLSYQTRQQENPAINSSLPESQTSFLILNSVSFLETSRSLMDQHKEVKLYLDRDKAGVQQTQKLLQQGNQYQDCSTVYKGFKDYNDLLTNKPLKEEHRQGHKRRL